MIKFHKSDLVMFFGHVGLVIGPTKMTARCARRIPTRDRPDPEYLVLKGTDGVINTVWFGHMEKIT